MSVTTTSGGRQWQLHIRVLPACYNFKMHLPTDWDGIVPAAPRNGMAETGYAKLAEQGTKCYDVLFKIRRWFDVTVLKWEERSGAVQRGAGWTMTATPKATLGP